MAEMVSRRPARLDFMGLAEAFSAATLAKTITYMRGNQNTNKQANKRGLSGDEPAPPRGVGHPFGFAGRCYSVDLVHGTRD